jgi:hypothetical protein
MRKERLLNSQWYQYVQQALPINQQIELYEYVKLFQTAFSLSATVQRFKFDNWELDAAVFVAMAG